MHEDAERVTAEAGRHIVVGAPVLQQLRRQEEQAVAGLAAFATVDRSQVVDIDGDDAEIRGAMADVGGWPGDMGSWAPDSEVRLADGVVEPPSVDQPGERVEIGRSAGDGRRPGGRKGPARHATGHAMARNRPSLGTLHD